MIAPPGFGDRAEPGRFLRLGLDNVPEMLALVERTKPGPFAKRTIELGPYLGLRNDNGDLVAMAGTRMRLDGYAELSAVCTDTELRGQGIATAIMETVAAELRAQTATSRCPRRRRQHHRDPALPEPRFHAAVPFHVRVAASHA